MSLWSKLRDEATPPAVGANAPAAPTPTGPRNEESRTMAMLKREELTSAPTAAGDLNALLGRGSEFEGKLTFEGTVRIDGKFNGTIITNDVLVVGEGAKISAEISCGTIIVHGEIMGNVRAKTAVELHHPAKMRGNLETPSLMIEKGVVFEGQCKMDLVPEKGSSKPTSSPSPSPSPSTSGQSPSPVTPVAASPR
jgi:cytoskeletal protein CcmA (bactofilin family)